MRRIALMLALLLAACGDDDSVTTLTYIEDDITPTLGGNTTSSVPSGATTTTGTTVTTLAGSTTTNTQPLVGTSVVITMVGTTVIGSAALSVNGDVYTINWNALVGPIVFSPPVGPDPYFLVHTSPPHDGFFFSIEAYTTYGPDWTGQLGTFDIDCTSTGTGICVHFDPDGNGPMPDLGADYLAVGTAEILQADGDNFVAILRDIEFSDGSTIPGPFTISG